MFPCQKNKHYQTGLERLTLEEGKRRTEEIFLLESAEDTDLYAQWLSGLQPKGQLPTWDIMHPELLWTTSQNHSKNIAADTMAASPTGQTHLHAFEQDGAEIEAK